MFQTFTGKEYLMIDIANNYGLDREDWDVRIDWFKQNEHQLSTLVKTAEKPALFYAGIKAWKHCKDNQPSGYPISLDATSSGIQILACLTNDRKAAMLCNVLDIGHRADAYTGLYMEMIERIGDTSKIDRKETKKAIMTAFYGSTAMPKNIFGEGELLDAFFDTMETNAPYAWELNKTMLAIWNPTNLINEWVLPDNFHVKVKVMANQSERVNFLNQPFEVTYSVNAPIENGRSLGANMTHSVDGMICREMVRRCSYDVFKVNKIRDWLRNGAIGAKATRTAEDKLVYELSEHYRESGFFSARILDYITMDNLGHVNKDALNELIRTLPVKPFDVLSVHDCFRCLPNYGNDLRRCYNQLLAEIANSELLCFIISQIVKRRISVNKPENLYKEILEANYALS